MKGLYLGNPCPPIVPFLSACACLYLLVVAAQMVPGVLIMTTYKLLLVPHRLPRRGTSSVNNSSAQGSAAGPDERFFPFGHLPKEYVQVRERALLFKIIFSPFFVWCL